ncbi:hypothetical protein V8C86DRAFT_1059343 [Haematococcus lacustris]
MLQKLPETQGLAAAVVAAAIHILVVLQIASCGSVLHSVKSSSSFPRASSTEQKLSLKVNNPQLVTRTLTPDSTSGSIAGAVQPLMSLHTTRTIGCEQLRCVRDCLSRHGLKCKS